MTTNRKEFQRGIMANDKKELQFVRFTESASFSLISYELVEQIKDDTLIVENIFKYGPQLLEHPGVFFYGVIDPNLNKVVGFFWASVDVFQNRLKIFFMSILPAYQQTGILAKFFELAKNIVDKEGLTTTVDLFSLHPKIAQRYGGVESRCKIYEFNTANEDYGKLREKESE